MSKIEIKPFEEQIRIAGIAGELERAEDKGLANGCAETEEKFILKLLKTMGPDEISKEFEVPLERVLEIEGDNS